MCTVQCSRTHISIFYVLSHMNGGSGKRPLLRGCMYQRWLRACLRCPLIDWIPSMSPGLEWTPLHAARMRWTVSLGGCCSTNTCLFHLEAGYGVVGGVRPWCPKTILAPASAGEPPCDVLPLRYTCGTSLNRALPRRLIQERFASIDGGITFFVLRASWLLLIYATCSASSASMSGTKLGSTAARNGKSSLSWAFAMIVASRSTESPGKTAYCPRLNSCAV